MSLFDAPRASWVLCDAHAHAWRAKMAMGVHTEKDREPAVDAIAPRFSSMLDTVTARNS